MASKRNVLWLAAALMAVGFVDCGGASTAPVDAPDASRTGGSGGGSTGSSGSAGSSGSTGSSTGGAGLGGSGGGRAGDGGSAGVEVDGGSPRCGGLLGLTCMSDEFCDFEASNCGVADLLGVCRKRPEVCLADCPGVCGCDGKFYCNACTAQSAGVDISSDTSCMRSDAGIQGDGGLNTPCADDSQCRVGLKCCYPCGIPGCMNACIPPTDSGRCPLFP